MAEKDKPKTSGESATSSDIEDEARRRKMSIDEAREMINNYANRILKGDEVEYGEVPLHREYFFNPQLIERDLTKFGEGNESQKNVPWQELKRKGVAEGRKAAVWSLGQQTDWDEYLTVAAREYGFLSGRGNKPLAKDLDKALEILKLVAGAEVDRDAIDAEVVRHIETGGKPATKKNETPEEHGTPAIDYDNPLPISGGSGLPEEGEVPKEAEAVTAKTESETTASLREEIEQLREAMAAVRQMAEDANADKQQAAADRAEAQKLRDATDEKERQLDARLKREAQEKAAEKNAADAAKQKATPPPSLPSAPKHQSNTSQEQFVGMGTSRMSALSTLRPTVRNPLPSANTPPAPAQEQAPADAEDTADSAASE